MEEMTIVKFIPDDFDYKEYKTKIVRVNYREIEVLKRLYQSAKGQAASIKALKDIDQTAYNFLKNDIQVIVEKKVLEDGIPCYFWAFINKPCILFIDHRKLIVFVKKAPITPVCNYEKQIFLGNGENSLKEVNKLYRQLNEALIILSRIQQIPYDTDSQKIYEKDMIKVNKIAKNIFTKLTGKEILF